MNNKGQAMLGAAILSAIFLFIIGMMVVDLIKPEITTARAVANLDCTNSTGISDGTKLTCLGIDLLIPYFFLLIISITGGVIIAKFVV